MKSQPPWMPVESGTGQFSSGAIFFRRSANCAMAMFWHVRTSEPGGAPGGAMAFLQKVRLAGSAFFILGLAASSAYAETGRSSVWYAILKRSASRARIMGSTVSASSDAPGGALATISNRSVLAHSGRPASSS